MLEDASAKARRLIRSETVTASTPLCPEIQLHLVTEACALWRATDADLQALELVEPYWAFCWAGGQALARFLLDRPELVRGKRVLDFGAGGAIEGIAAALAGALEVCAADIDPVAIEAAILNAEHNGVSLRTTTDDLVGRLDLDFDVVVAGDVCYETAQTSAVFEWLGALHAAHGTLVLIGDPGRGFLPTERLERLAEYMAPSDDERQLRPTSIYAFP